MPEKIIIELIKIECCERIRFQLFVSNKIFAFYIFADHVEGDEINNLTKNDENICSRNQAGIRHYAINLKLQLVGLQKAWRRAHETLEQTGQGLRSADDIMEDTELIESKSRFFASECSKSITERRSIAGTRSVREVLKMLFRPDIIKTLRKDFLLYVIAMIQADAMHTLPPQYYASLKDVDVEDYSLRAFDSEISVCVMLIFASGLQMLSISKFSKSNIQSLYRVETGYWAPDLKGFKNSAQCY